MKNLFKLLILAAVFGLTVLNGQEAVFKLKTVSGKELVFKGVENGVVTSPYEGKVVILEFWGTWCGPCLLSIPHEVALQKKYKDNLKIVAVETSPNVTDSDLKKFKVLGAKAIDMSKVEWFLKHKASSPQAQAYFKKPVEELKKFIESGEKINYDLISSTQAGAFINYIASRAGWRGGIPFIIIFKPDGEVSNVIQGMATFKDLEKAYLEASNSKSGNK